ncbi:uncharacterized protein LOC118198832 [Stegodyphus dumicola]|uniref:uncharacterized protein LOC118198832 n=1 Tax=Stegodyphus dumicola TaxID=202533 RepID=UPI0015B14EA1|nr:uncharacterized protein LOC118198832 [Stegodyphus dumicola]
MNSIYSRYWKTVFTFNFSEKDKRNFTLLHQKVSRPEGFFGDSDECLSILTAIEDVFCQIKRRWPLITVCIEKIQDLRATCADLFQKKREIENSISNTEYQNVLNAFDFNWIIINRLCGMVMDFCQIPHDFDYAKPDVLPPAADFSRLMCNLYPAVQQLKQIMSSMFEALQKSTPTKKIFIKLHKCLKDFIPSLEIETDFPTLPHFTQRALQNFCLSPNNRQLIENGYKQLEIFNTKLHEALGVMMALKQNRAPGLMQLE